MKKAERKNVIFFLALGLFAFCLRLWNVISIGDDFYANFISDASTFKLWASQIISGISPSESVFPMGPLYPYFLASNLKLGFSFYSVLFLQAVLGSLVAVMVGITAGRIFGRSAGYISGILSALYAPFIFYDGLLLSEALQIFLIALSLLLLFPKSRKQFRKWNSLIAGFLIGLAALGRGTILLFPLLIAVFWLGRYFIRKEKKFRSYPANAVMLIMGVLAGIMPATMHNLSHGDFVPISSNFGINFYIGNNAFAMGAYDRPAGLNLTTDFTGRKVAERESGRILKSSEVSSFWTAKTLQYVRSSPISFIAGMFKKLWLYLWRFDIPQAESIQIQDEFSSVFKLPLIGFGLVSVFGIIGMIFHDRDDRIWILILLFLASIAGCVIFFAIGRFKLTGSLALLITSGGGIILFYDAVRNHRWRQVFGPSAAVIAIVTVLYLPRPLDRTAKIASAYDNVGTYHYFKNRPDRAVKWFRRALFVKADHSGALGNVGAYYYTSGEIDSARYYFHRSLEFDPGADKTLMNLGRVARDMGMIDSARYYYDKAKEVAPFGVDADLAIRELEMMKSDSAGGKLTSSSKSFNALNRLGERASAAREFERAEKLYKKALEIRPDDAKTLNNLGFVYQAQSKFEPASKMFLRVLEVSEGNAVAFNNLASVVYRIGMADSAIILWQEALRHDPDNPQIKKNLDYAQKLKKQ